MIAADARADAACRQGGAGTRYDRRMKRSLAWVAGVFGIAALGRALSKRGTAEPAVESSLPAPDPAAALRRTLAAQRGDEVGDEAPAAADAGEPAGTLEERRARVHAKAQEAIDAMRDPGADA
jgi:hypothetical protein